MFENLKNKVTNLVEQAQDKASDLDLDNVIKNAQNRVVSLANQAKNTAENVYAKDSWSRDITELHDVKGHAEAVLKLSPELLKAFLQHRVNQLKEEVQEIEDAIAANDAEGVVDGFIDLNVFALGTLDLYGVDANKAWKAVHNANMAKNAGVKPERPNPYGLPDLIKPDGWVAPSHEGNHGMFDDIFKN